MSRWVLSSVLILSLCTRAKAQSSATADPASVKQFWPEVDVYVPIASDIRFDFQAKDTREGQQSIQLQIGPSVEFYLKPLVRLRDESTLPKDEARSRLLVISAGYRYLPAPPRGQAENRIVLAATPTYPLGWKIALSDRNQMELRFIGGVFSWRYRNRIALQRPFQIHSYKFTPYARCEFYYSSQYSKWYDTAISAGTKLPVTKRIEFDTYYEHQNQTNRSPNKQIQSLGLVLNVFF
jgi:hypothetical protein